MDIAIIASNGNFTAPVIAELDRRGHDLLVYQHTDNDAHNAFQIGQAVASCERVFVDWAQPPLENVLGNFECPIFVRAHRLEMYNDAYIRDLPWSKVAALFFIARHVQERFLSKCNDKPARTIVLPHVGVDGAFWVPDPEKRTWAPPWRIVLAGNIVPKKRVYTAIQLAYDLPEEFQLVIRGNGGMPGYGNDEYAQNCTDLILGLDLAGGRVDASEAVSKEDLRDLFQRSHFVLSASNEEGCHTTVAEGMACGCVPLVGHWRGAEKVYPPEWTWNSPREFYALVEGWVAEYANDPEQAQALSAAMRAAVIPAYDARAIAEQIADIVTGPLDAATVGAWYSTTMLDHMVEQDGNPRQQDALAVVQELLASLPPLDIGRRAVLEIGCGTGWLTRQLAAQGHRAVGQDIATGLLAFATQHNPDGAEFVEADACQILPTGPYDVVTLIDVLEHVQEKKREAIVVRAAHELKPGGFMVARFPHQAKDRQIIEETVWPKVLRKTMTRHGLEITSFREVPPYFEIVGRKVGD